MTKKILIIDDDPDFTEAVSTLLEAKGYEIITASNGKEGFEKAVKNSPNLIFLDVMMTSKTEGFDTAQNFKNNSSTKDTPIVIVTGIKREMNLPFGFEPNDEWLPVKAILEKPVKPELLIKTVEEYIK